MKYGYSSPDAFTRVFQGFHGVTPRGAKTIGNGLKAIPPMTFQLTIKGGSKMDYRIVEKEAFPKKNYKLHGQKLHLNG